MTRFLRLFGLSLAILCIHGLLAQTSSTGAVTGSVKDSTGAAIANATVTLTSLETGQTRVTVTNGGGTYNLSLLPPGTYKVEIAVKGFATFEVPALEVHVTESATIDGTLHPTSVNQSIVISGEASQAIQTETSTLGTLVNSRAIVGLPFHRKAGILLYHG